MVDHSLLQQIPSTVSLNHRDFYDTIDTYIESEEYSYFDLEELWDVMHYLMTGQSAIDPLEGNLKSQALVGIVVLDFDQPTTFIDHIKVKAIAKALSKVDFSKCLSKFKIKSLLNYEIYPDIWDDYVDEIKMRRRLNEKFDELQAFYQEAAKKGCGVVVCHYEG